MSDARLNKILWRCRRGTRELDAILGGFAEAEYLTLDAALQSQFDQLLQEQDSDLANWLGYEASSPSIFQGIVARILLHKHDMLAAQSRRDDN